jgi:hypothetical protein
MRPSASTFATRVDFDATVSINFCHQSGLEVATIEVDLSS